MGANRVESSENQFLLLKMLNLFDKKIGYLSVDFIYISKMNVLLEIIHLLLILTCEFSIHFHCFSIFEGPFDSFLVVKV